MRLFRENGVLYTECKMELKFPIKLNDKLYCKEDKVSYQDIDIVYELLKLNARVLINIDGKFKKPDLYWLGTTLLEKKYDVVEGLPNNTNVEDEASEAAVFNPVPEIKEEIEEEVVEEDSEDEKDTKNENHGKNRKKRNNNNNQEGDK